MPFKLAFLDTEDFDGWWFTDIFIDTLFFIDIIINLNSAYLDNDGNFVTDRKRIFLNYLKSWLIIDLIACIPINLIETLTSSSEEDS
mmetsp:Transcript_15313/g.2554  ORF Transcript_15313/g.2554 Transcript_15313/m.2554 type:complete len:87 (+) Transcript_15313:389-649(+)